MFSGLTRYEQWLILGLIAILGLGLAARQARLGRSTLTLELGAAQASTASSQALAPFSSASASSSTATSSSTAVQSGSAAVSVLGALPAQSSLVPEIDWTAPDRLDINTATAADWERLPDIGPSKAAAIVADRQANGPFRSVDDLDRVKGIGKGILERIRPMLTTGGVAAETTPPSPRPLVPPRSTLLPAAAPPAGAAALVAVPAESGPVNINTAEWEDLTRLQGIGELLAKRIVQYRAAHGRFRRAEDLQNVRGIGPKVVEKNRAMIRVD